MIVSKRVIDVEQYSQQDLETVLALDGNYKDKPLIATVPTGTALNASDGYMFTGSSGLRFDEYPGQEGYAKAFIFSADKDCEIRWTVSSLNAANLERIHRGHNQRIFIKANTQFVIPFGAFVSPGTSLNVYLMRIMPAERGVATTEPINLIVNYSWYEVPLNADHVRYRRSLFFWGDSNMYGYGATRTLDNAITHWTGQLANYFFNLTGDTKQINRAIAGSTVADMALMARNNYLRTSNNDKVGVALFMACTNPILTDNSKNAAMPYIYENITVMRKLFKNATIIVMGTIYYPGIPYEAILKTIRQAEMDYVAGLNDPRVVYFDASSVINGVDPLDGPAGSEVHMYNQGSAKLANALINFITTKKITL